MKAYLRGSALALAVALPLTLGACSGSSEKPAKADVKAGFSKIIKDTAGSSAVPEDLLTKIVDCAIDKSYDKLSADTLNKMKDGDKDAEGPSKEDTKVIEESVQACSTELIK